MNKSIFLSGIVVSAIGVIAPAVSAQLIVNGIYSDAMPGNHGYEIRRNSFSIWYDDAAPEPWKPIPKGIFNSIKRGVFYDKINHKYYCLSDNRLERERTKNGYRAMFICSQNGWKRKALR
jgi:hypothetical protein